MEYLTKVKQSKGGHASQVQEVLVGGEELEELLDLVQVQDGKDFLNHALVVEYALLDHKKVCRFFQVAQLITVADE